MLGSQVPAGFFAKTIPAGVAVFANQRFWIGPAVGAQIFRWKKGIMFFLRSIQFFFPLSFSIIYSFIADMIIVGGRKLFFYNEPMSSSSTPSSKNNTVHRAGATEGGPPWNI